MGPDASRSATAVEDGVVESFAPDLATMPIAGLTRGRLLLIAGAIAAIWIAFAFARQVGAAGELTDRADALRAGNAELEARVAELQAELELIQTPQYIGLQAHAYRLGKSNEVPFTLAADAPPLRPDAPGSASTAIGAHAAESEPIEAWLTLLFAPTD
jgi:cell division protein FtsB